MANNNTNNSPFKRDEWELDYFMRNIFTQGGFDERDTLEGRRLTGVSPAYRGMVEAAQQELNLKTIIPAIGNILSSAGYTKQTVIKRGTDYILLFTDDEGHKVELVLHKTQNNGLMFADNMERINSAIVKLTKNHGIGITTEQTEYFSLFLDSLQRVVKNKKTYDALNPDKLTRKIKNLLSQLYKNVTRLPATGTKSMAPISDSFKLGKAGESSAERIAEVANQVVTSHYIEQLVAKREKIRGVGMPKTDQDLRSALYDIENIIQSSDTEAEVARKIKSKHKWVYDNLYDGVGGLKEYTLKMYASGGFNLGTRKPGQFGVTSLERNPTFGISLLQSESNKAEKNQLGVLGDSVKSGLGKNKRSYTGNAANYVSPSFSLSKLQKKLYSDKDLEKGKAIGGLFNVATVSNKAIALAGYQVLYDNYISQKNEQLQFTDDVNKSLDERLEAFLKFFEDNHINYLDEAREYKRAKGVDVLSSLLGVENDASVMTKEINDLTKATLTSKKILTEDLVKALRSKLGTSRDYLKNSFEEYKNRNFKKLKAKELNKKLTSDETEVLKLMERYNEIGKVEDQADRENQIKLFFRGSDGLGVTENDSGIVGSIFGALSGGGNTNKNGWQREVLAKAIESALGYSSKNIEDRPAVDRKSIKINDDGTVSYTATTRYDTYGDKFVAGRSGDIRTLTGVIDEKILRQALVNEGYDEKNLGDVGFAVGATNWNSKKTYRSNLLGMLNYIVARKRRESGGDLDKAMDVLSQTEERLLSSGSSPMGSKGEDVSKKIFGPDGFLGEVLNSGNNNGAQYLEGDEEKLIEYIENVGAAYTLKNVFEIGKELGYYTGDFDVTDVSNGKGLFVIDASKANILLAHELQRSLAANNNGVVNRTNSRFRYGLFELQSMENTVKGLKKLAEINGTTEEERERLISAVDENFGVPLEKMRKKFREQQAELGRYGIHANLISRDRRMFNEEKFSNYKQLFDDGLAFKITEKEALENGGYLDYEKDADVFDKSFSYEQNSLVKYVSQKLKEVYEAAIQKYKEKKPEATDEEAALYYRDTYGINSYNDIVGLLELNDTFSGTDELGEGYLSKYIALGRPDIKEDGTGNFTLSEGGQRINNIANLVSGLHDIRMRGHLIPELTDDKIQKEKNKLFSAVFRGDNTYLEALSKGSLWEQFSKIEEESSGWLLAQALNKDTLESIGITREELGVGPVAIKNIKDYRAELMDFLRGSKENRDDFLTAVNRLYEKNGIKAIDAEEFAKNQKKTVKDFLSYFTIGSENFGGLKDASLFFSANRFPTIKNKEDTMAGSMFLAGSNLLGRGRVLLDKEYFAAHKGDFDGDQLADLFRFAVFSGDEEWQSLLYLPYIESIIEGQNKIKKAKKAPSKSEAKLEDDILKIINGDKGALGAQSGAAKSAGIFGNLALSMFGALSEKVGLDPTNLDDPKNSAARLISLFAGALYQDGINIKNTKAIGGFEDTFDMFKTAASRKSWADKEGIGNFIGGVIKSGIFDKDEFFKDPVWGNYVKDLTEERASSLFTLTRNKGWKNISTVLENITTRLGKKGLSSDERDKLLQNRRDFLGLVTLFSNGADRTEFENAQLEEFEKLGANFDLYKGLNGQELISGALSWMAENGFGKEVADAAVGVYSPFTTGLGRFQTNYKLERLRQADVDEYLRGLGIDPSNKEVRKQLLEKLGIYNFKDSPFSEGKASGNRKLDLTSLTNYNESERDRILSGNPEKEGRDALRATTIKGMILNKSFGAMNTYGLNGYEDMSVEQVEQAVEEMKEQVSSPQQLEKLGMFARTFEGTYAHALTEIYGDYINELLNIKGVELKGLGGVGSAEFYNKLWTSLDVVDPAEIEKEFDGSSLSKKAIKKIIRAKNIAQRKKLDLDKKLEHFQNGLGSLKGEIGLTDKDTLATLGGTQVRGALGSQQSLDREVLNYVLETGLAGALGSQNIRGTSDMLISSLDRLTGEKILSVVDFKTRQTSARGYAPTFLPEDILQTLLYTRALQLLREEALEEGGGSTWFFSLGLIAKAISSNIRLGQAAELQRLFEREFYDTENNKKDWEKSTRKAKNKGLTFDDFMENKGEGKNWISENVARLDKIIEDKLLALLQDGSFSYTELLGMTESEIEDFADKSLKDVKVNRKEKDILKEALKNRLINTGKAIKTANMAAVSDRIEQYINVGDSKTGFVTTYRVDTSKLIPFIKDFDKIGDIISNKGSLDIGSLAAEMPDGADWLKQFTDVLKESATPVAGAFSDKDVAAKVYEKYNNEKYGKIIRDYYKTKSRLSKVNYDIANIESKEQGERDESLLAKLYLSKERLTNILEGIDPITGIQGEGLEDKFNKVKNSFEEWRNNGKNDFMRNLGEYGSFLMLMESSKYNKMQGGNYIDRIYSAKAFISLRQAEIALYEQLINNSDGLTSSQISLLAGLLGKARDSLVLYMLKVIEEIGEDVVGDESISNTNKQKIMDLFTEQIGGLYDATTNSYVGPSGPKVLPQEELEDAQRKGDIETRKAAEKNRREGVEYYTNVYKAEDNLKRLLLQLDKEKDPLKKDFILSQIEALERELDILNREREAYRIKMERDPEYVGAGWNPGEDYKEGSIGRRIMDEALLKRRLIEKDYAGFSNGPAGGKAGQLGQMMLSRIFSGYGLMRIFYRILAAIKKFIALAEQMNQVITNLRIVTGKSTNEVRNMIHLYAELGSAIGASAVEVALSAQEWMRQGYDMAEVADLTTASMYLSKLGMIDVAAATSALTSSLKGFKIEASDATSIVDRLTAIDMEAATSAGEIANGLLHFANIGLMAGVTIDEAASYIATIADVSQMSGDAVGNAMKTIISRYSNVKAGAYGKLNFDAESADTTNALNDVERVLGRLGISTRSSNMQFKDFDVILSEIASKWGSLDNVSLKAIATAFAGTRQQEAFVTLLENWDKYEHFLDVSQSSKGTSEEKYESYKESIAAKKGEISAVWLDFINSAEVDEFLKHFLDFSKAFVSHIPLITELLSAAVQALMYRLAITGNTLASAIWNKRTFLGTGRNDIERFINGTLGNVLKGSAADIWGEKRAAKKAQRAAQNGSASGTSNVTLNSANAAGASSSTTATAGTTAGNAAAGNTAGTTAGTTPPPQGNTPQGNTAKSGAQLTSLLNENKGGGISGLALMYATLTISQMLSDFTTNLRTHKTETNKTVLSSEKALKEGKAIEIAWDFVPIIGGALGKLFSNKRMAKIDFLRDKLQEMADQAGETAQSLSGVSLLLSLLSDLSSVAHSQTERDELITSIQEYLYSELGEKARRGMLKYLGDGETVYSVLLKYSSSDEKGRIAAAKELKYAQLRAEEDTRRDTRENEKFLLKEDIGEQETEYLKLQEGYTAKGITNSQLWKARSEGAGTGVLVGSLAGGATMGASMLAAGGAAALASGPIGWAVGLAVGVAAVTTALVGVAKTQAAIAQEQEKAREEAEQFLKKSISERKKILVDKRDEIEKKIAGIENGVNGIGDDEQELISLLLSQLLATNELIDKYQEYIDYIKAEGDAENSKRILLIVETKATSTDNEESDRYGYLSEMSEGELSALDIINAQENGGDYRQKSSAYVIAERVMEAFKDVYGEEGLFFNSFYNGDSKDAAGNKEFSDYFVNKLMAAIKEDDELYSAVTQRNKTLSDFIERAGQLDQFEISYLELFSYAVNAPLEALYKNGDYSSDNSEISDEYKQKYGLLTLSDVIKSQAELEESMGSYRDVISSMVDPTKSMAEIMTTLTNLFPDLLSYGNDYVSIIDKTIEKLVQFNNQELNLEWLDLTKSQEYYNRTVKPSIKQYFEERKWSTDELDLKLEESLTTSLLMSYAYSNSGDETWQRIAEALAHGEASKDTLNADTLTSLVLEYVEWRAEQIREEAELLLKLKEQLEKINEQREYERKIVEAELKLKEAEENKSRVYRAGIGWVYEANQEDIGEAQENLEDLEVQKAISKLEVLLLELNHSADLIGNIYNVLKKENTVKEMLSLEENYLAKFQFTDDEDGALQVSNSNLGSIQKALSGDEGISLSFGEFYTKWLDTKDDDRDRRAERVKKAYDDFIKNPTSLSAEELGSAISTFKEAGYTQDNFYDYMKEKYPINAMQYATALEDGEQKVADYKEKNDKTRDMVFARYVKDPDPKDNHTNLIVALGERATGLMSKQSRKKPNGISIAKDKEGEFLTLNIDSWEKNGNYYAEIIKYLDGHPSWGDNSLIYIEDFDSLVLYKDGLLFSTQTYTDPDKKNTVLDKKDLTFKSLLLSDEFESHNNAKANTVQRGSIMGDTIEVRQFAATGTTDLDSAYSDHQLINEKGTEAIVTPYGTITALPSHTGIIPADITKNLWELGEVAPNLMSKLSSIRLIPDTLGPSNVSNSTTDESFNVNSLVMNVNADGKFDANAFEAAIRSKVALTRNQRF